MAITLALYKFWYLDYKIAAYEDIPDLSNEYNVDTELIQAQTKLNSDIEPATVYTRDPSKNVIALTFDGLPDPTTTDKLLDLIDIKSTGVGHNDLPSIVSKMAQNL